jgi:hypothetical protein
MIEQLAAGFQQASPRLRAVYVAAVIIPFLLLIMLAGRLVHHGEARITPDRIDQASASSPRPASSVVPAPAVRTGAQDKAKGRNKPRISAPGKKVIGSKVAGQKPKHSESLPKTTVRNDVGSKPAGTTSGGNSNAHISISCREGTEVYVDGARKLRIASSPLTIPVTPGKHTVIVSYPSAGVYSQDVAIEEGKTAHINPGFCK